MPESIMRCLILAAALIGTIPTASATPSCPGDTVVWVNQNTGVYHLPGDRWYGRTKHGAYECERQAEAEGGHRSGVRMARHRAATTPHRKPGRASNTIEDQVNNARPAGAVENPF